MARGHKPDNDEMPLPERLSEFRTALKEAIEAASRNESSSAIPLINGRRIAHIGGSYQYAFDVENALNLPGDAPGDLYLPGHEPMEVMVVSVEGMSITLSVTQDLGQFVSNASLRSNLTFLMRKLIGRIEGWGSKPNPVGDRILGEMQVSGSPIPVSDLRDWNLARDDGKRLNKDQLCAIASSLGRDATFIWGPPGTGKTETIGAIGEHLYRRQRSVLLVSHTNAAVDQAIIKIADAIGLAELEKGQVLRVGDPADKRLEGEKYREVLLKTHTDRRSAELANRRDSCMAERSAAATEVIRLSRMIDVLEWIEEGERDIARMVSDLAELSVLEGHLENARLQEESLLQQRPQWEIAVAGAKLAKGWQSEVSGFDQRITVTDDYAAPLREALAVVSKELAGAESLLNETIAIGNLRRMWRGLPARRTQEAALRKLATKRDSLQEEVKVADDVLADLRDKRAVSASAIASFCKEHQGTPDEVLAWNDACLKEIAECNEGVALLQQDRDRRQEALYGLLFQRLAALREWGLTTAQPADLEGMLDSVRKALETAKLQVGGRDLSSVKRERDDLNGAIGALDAELKGIEVSLKRVEEVVIAEAVVVATTLTRAYLRDSIQSRRFDTLILDEASMAPIPAIWVAASTATSNAVLVGDFRQLPPIVISENDLPKTWLGRDVFEVVGIVGNEDPTGRRVDLLEQHRMHPQISVIPNELFYGRKLKDAPGMHSNGEEALATWYRADWGNDNPVLLVDTGSVGAWVTSVSRGSRASRLNFLSATICVDLAARLLRADLKRLGSSDRPRILIACPYRPHAKLLEILIKEEGLARDSNAGATAVVEAGTAHSFQGSEADVVIMDLVNDEPHFRVGMFDAKRNPSVKRLMNVALTRAKRRLIVVGDFAYIQKKANKEAFLRREFLPFLLSHFPRVDARDVVPVGLAARAAKAQSKITGGSFEVNAERASMTQEMFYSVLQDDIAKARQRIVIYSAFITQERLGLVAPHLRAAVERGVRVYVVTKERSERKKQLANYRMLEKALAEWGITVIHKRGMHEKLAFIDDEVSWLGSLNILSFSNTEEYMERWRSEKIADHRAKTVMLNELLAPYEKGRPSCPVCGEEEFASEGRNEPFYWTCENRCYPRSLDQPPLTGGVIVCAKCGGPVEFGVWGGNPKWRCKENQRHRQPIARSHLRLPKMLELVPKSKLKKLEDSFGRQGSARIQWEDFEGQRNLFDL